MSWEFLNSAAPCCNPHVLAAAGASSAKRWYNGKQIMKNTKTKRQGKKRRNPSSVSHNFRKIDESRLQVANRQAGGMHVPRGYSTTKTWATPPTTPFHFYSCSFQTSEIKRKIMWSNPTTRACSWSPDRSCSRRRARGSASPCAAAEDPWQPSSPPPPRGRKGNVSPPDP